MDGIYIPVNICYQGNSWSRTLNQWVVMFRKCGGSTGLQYKIGDGMWMIYRY